MMDSAVRLLCTTLFLGLFAGTVFAQTYPARPVTMVIPQAVSGTNDIVGRLIAQKLGEALGGNGQPRKIAITTFLIS